MGLAAISGDTTRNGWLAALRKMEQGSVDVGTRQIINSFLIEYGYGQVSSNPADLLGRIKNTNKRSGTIEGVGLYALITNSGNVRENIKEYLGGVSGKIDTSGLDENLKAWTNFFDSMYFYYKNITTVAIKKLTFENGVASLESLFENEKTMRSAELGRRMLTNVYDNITTPNKDVLKEIELRITQFDNTLKIDGELVAFKNDKGIYMPGSAEAIMKLLNLYGFKSVDIHIANLITDKGFNEKYINGEYTLAQMLFNIPNVYQSAHNQINGVKTAETEKLEEDLNAFYSSLGLTQDPYENPNEEEGTVIENGEVVYIRNIKDVWPLRDRIADAYNIIMAENASRVDFNSEGNPVYKDNISNYLLDLLPNLEYSKNENYPPTPSGNYRNKINTAVENGMAVNSPLMSEGKWNNPIISGKVEFDRIDILDGMSTEYIGKRFTKMSEHDRWKTFLNIFKKNITRSGKMKMLTLLDPMGDRSTMYSMDWYFGSEKSGQTEKKPFYVRQVVDNKKFEILNMKMNKAMFVEAIDEIADYYQKAHEMAKIAWEAALSITPEGQPINVFNLKENEHYNIEEKERSATLTEEGIAKMEEMMGIGNIYTEKGIKEVHHIESALKAQVLFKKD